MITRRSVLERRLGVLFYKKELLESAFTHRSYTNEKKSTSLPDNERLEFLGDAVLELVVTEELFYEFPLFAEGKLTQYRSALVCGENLARVANKLGIEEFLKLSCGERKNDGRPRARILANTLEAIIGAMYCDRGYDIVRSFVRKHILVCLRDICSNKNYLDPKSALQVKTQKYLGVIPDYRVHEIDGPKHCRRYKVSVHFGDAAIAVGEGDSLKRASQKAAVNALAIKKWS
jgi:ribonuclease-3